jgi:hypothetical protein
MREARAFVVPGGPAPPLPPGYNNPAPTLRMLDEYTAAGHDIDTILVDRGFSNWEETSWANELLRRDIDQVIDINDKASPVPSRTRHRSPPQEEDLHPAHDHHLRIHRGQTPPAPAMGLGRVD